MRRRSIHQMPRTIGEIHPQHNREMNPKMWVQLIVDQHQQMNILLEEQQRQTNRLLVTVQQLQEEMV